MAGVGMPLVAPRMFTIAETTCQSASVTGTAMIHHGSEPLASIPVTAVAMKP